MPRLQRWKETARAAITNSRLTPDAKRSQLSKLDSRIETYDLILRDYAEHWKKVSCLNRERGVYSRVLDFFGPTEGLTLDIGCGAGTFLEVLGRPDVIGVDLNTYCLANAYEALKAIGFDPFLSNSLNLDFNLQRGLHLRPDHVSVAPSLDQPILIADDMKTMEHTLHLMRLLGRKADVVSVMFLGGSQPLSSIEREATGSKQIIPSVDGIVIPVLPKICNPGARVLFVFRTAEAEIKDSLSPDVERSLKEMENFPSTPEGFSKLYGRVLELRRMDSFNLPDTDAELFLIQD